MGLREKTDFNLQAVSLACALLVILILCAARHYTSDWRERRLFKRRLAETRQRLTPDKENISEDSPDWMLRHQQTLQSGDNAPSNDISAGGGVSESNGITNIKQRNSPHRDVRQKYRNPTGKRRQWKRFVAALPLMPLATAYIAARLGWDVFELLVFCAIDVVRDATSRSLVMAQVLAIHAREYGADLAARLEVGRRTQEMVISIVENTVVWLFQVAFPAIGEFLTRCGEWTRRFITWWIETGGPRVRDIVEEVVLNHLVPTYHHLATSLAYIYQRTVWFGGRTIEAVYVLGMDLVHDVNAIGNMVRTFAQWISSDERWWFNPALWQGLLEFGLPGFRWLKCAYLKVVDRFIPWCAVTLFNSLDAIYSNLLFPAVCWFKSGAEWLGKNAVAFAIAGVNFLHRLYTSCARIASSAAIFVGRIRAPLVRYSQAFIRLWAELCDMLRRQSWIIDGCLYAYSQARDAVFIPAISALTVAIRFVWKKILEPFASVVYIWLVNSLYPLAKQWSELLLARMHVLFAWERISAFLALGWSRVQQLFILLYRTVSTSPAVAYLKNAMGDSVQVLQQWIGELFVYLWPLAQRGWSDAAQAMYDVYRQLVSLVDVAVAMVGDYIVEFARSNTVHSTVSEQSPVFEKNKRAVGKTE